MILAIDIGNTGTTLGFYKNETLYHSLKISSIPHRSTDEVAMLFNSVCFQKEIDKTEVEGCVISSVVPHLTTKIKQAVEAVFSCNPLIITHGVKTGLNIRIDNHTQLGSDIVADTVAAACVLKKPFAVIDLGTATTISAVNSLGELTGVVIVPGVRLAVDALSSNAAELPYISLTKPKTLLGKNTEDSMLSGCVFGTAAMIDGIIIRLKEELGTDNLSVIACGGLADAVIPFCHTDIKIDPYLTLNGLYQIYCLNQRKSKST